MIHAIMSCPQFILQIHGETDLSSSLCMYAILFCHANSMNTATFHDFFFFSSVANFCNLRSTGAFVRAAIGRQRSPLYCLGRLKYVQIACFIMFFSPYIRSLPNLG
jgi:hypothetical protein